ncbi:AraC family transcriptional regulator [Nocardia cyriacigeorgica]|uniref:DNA-binding transcriptional activator FeaR n=1 Tax=Nocardia cyriacigeorgica TaxID=135487 RepID=A0A4U8W4B7_9NOCA|nr:AraC family transcriptional regulator [Nocardia cyriacigeorgica]MBF6100914.1 AraC family transcriptional regulator [Nocardia cyriacigeorgica]MBF6160373.1 AraC family transcriptional regulator [Nocardia cyriacigeorgica]MBF6199458.1 AraC family transcriptional regulator [Nocardia cyriacigeorgica]MBF6343135.1 AraC family transcriptional regulator [Nocardia cyriacigeorgica]MBF6515809.1 AraC family transcriptional regulator [Nocardia cyriacigeorgica]
MRYSELTVASAAVWTEVTDHFLTAEHRYRDPANWWSRITVQESSGYTLLRAQQRGDHLMNRSRTHIRRGPADHCWIVFPEHGEYVIQQPDRLTRVPPRHGFVLELDRACRVLLPGSTAYALLLPRAQLERRSVTGSDSQTVLDMSTALGQVVLSMLHTTLAGQSNLTALEFDAVCDRVTELLCLMLSGDIGPQQAHAAETIDAIRSFVRTNLGSGDVRLPAVAHALGWSPRQLRSVLHQAGITYRDLRRTEALRAARDLLSRPGPLAIGEVAARCGFTSAGFSTAFKSEYGETPRNFRRRRLSEQLAMASPHHEQRTVTIDHHA